MIDIYESILIDAHLSSVLQQRKSKVLGEEFVVVDANGNINEDATALLSKKWFSAILEGVIDSRFFGYSLIEVQDLVSGEIVSVKPFPRGNVIPEFKAIIRNPYQVTEGTLIPIEGRNDSDYYILIDSETLGILNQVVNLVLIKRTVMSYWAEHATIHGMPALILRSDNLDQTPKYLADMQKYLVSRNIVIGQNDTLEVLNSASNDPHQIYGQLINLCNWEISKAIVGQTSTSDEKSYVGSAEVHQDILNEISEADREYMSYFVNDVVFPKLSALGYGLDGLSFKFITREKRSYAEKLSTINQLTLAGYYPLGKDLKDYLDLPFEVPDYAGEKAEAGTAANAVEKKSPIETAKAIAECSGACIAGVCDCKDIIALANEDVDDLYSSELEAIVDSIIEDVYFNRNVNVISAEYIRSVGELMFNAVMNSFGYDSDADFDSEDVEFLNALRQKTYYFVGGKAKAMTKSFNEMLLDGSGAIRPFNEFKKEAKGIGLSFNNADLKAEYNLAIAQAQSISDWRSYEDGDILEFSAVMDARNRPEHAKLNGLQFKKTDSIWNSITPPLGWGCRCRLVVVPNGKASKLSASERKELRSIPDKGFKYNPAKTGDLFPKDHLYIKSLSQSEKDAIDITLQNK
ncbi:DUF935 family protein [Chryseolinea sp. T2]